jgi:hypothetical protein
MAKPTMENDFSSFLKDRLRDRGLSLKRVSEASGIPVNFLEGLVYGDEEKLPPAPYLRGYLVKLGRLLDFDYEPLWKEFKDKQTLKISGPEDKLPQNRFAVKTGSKNLWLIAAVILIAGYLGLRLYPITGKPRLNVLSPAQALTSAEAGTLLVSGSAGPGERVFVNREEVKVGEGGGWEKRIDLQPGLNSIEITAKKFLGRETKIIRQVVYEPPTRPAATSTFP